MPKKSNSAFLISHDWERPLMEMTDKEAGAWIKALMQYSRNKTEPDFSMIKSPNVKMMLYLAMPAVKSQELKYNERCERNRQNAKKRYEKSQKPE